MKNLWLCDDWSVYIPEDCRDGVRIHFDKGVDEEVKRACKEFVCWLREYYYFPIRVPIYFKNKKQVKCRNGDLVSAVFFGPYDKKYEPYIKIAVDDYSDMLAEAGKDNALARILHSIAHEITHYFQWIRDMDFTKKRMEYQAKHHSREILYDYAETRDHP